MGKCGSKVLRIFPCIRRRQDGQYHEIVIIGAPLVAVTPQGVTNLDTDRDDDDDGVVDGEQEEAAQGDITLFLQVMAREPRQRTMPLTHQQLYGVLRVNGQSRLASGIVNDTANGTVNMLIKTSVAASRDWVGSEGKSRVAVALGGYYVVTAVEPTLRDDIAHALDDYNRQNPNAVGRNRSGSVIGFV